MSVQQLQAKLGTYASLVTFESAIDCIIIKPRAFLPKEKWSAINKLCREEGGKWVPIPGATGHWEVPLLKPLKLTAKGHIAIIEGELEWLKKWLTEEMK